MDFNQTIKPANQKPGLFIGVIFLIAGIVMTAIGAAGIIRTRGYAKTKALIVALDEQEETDSEGYAFTTYYPTVTYTVGGHTYTAKLSSNTAGDSLGREIKVKYDPADPSKVEADTPMLTVYLLVVGPAIIAVCAYMYFKNKKQRAAVAETGRPPSELI